MMFFTLCFIMTTFLITGTPRAATIPDSAGSNIYWGGRYVKVKPSAYADVIGRRSAVDRMEVIVRNEVMTVTVTGPYFFNYVHNIKRTQDASPGDLYISSQGWKVSGTPPYTEDVFAASEGWDYVVSLKESKVYRLKFSDIVMTSALPSMSKYRAGQAWRGGYGEAIDDAEVTLTDSGLSFAFSTRNMRLGSEIGLHWTMKCGNDIIEGGVLIPPNAVTPPVEPTSGEEAIPDPSDGLAMEPPAQPSPALPAGGTAAPTTFHPAGLAPVLAVVPVAWPRSSGSDDFVPPPDGPALMTMAIEPFQGEPQPHAPVPEPSGVLLLLLGLVAVLVRKRPFR